MTTEPTRNSNKIVMAIGLLFFLVILPGGSWYYLQQGLNYQKDLRKELGKYGEVPAFQLQGANDSQQDSSLFSKKISVVAFVTPEVLDDPKPMKILAKLYDQFDKKDESRLIVHALNWPTEKLSDFQALAEKYEINNPEKCFFLTGENETMQTIVNQSYKWPEKDAETSPLFKLSTTPQNTSNYPYFILVNTDREITNYYDYNDENRIKKMVEHIAILIPLEKRPKPRLKREQEK